MESTAHSYPSRINTILFWWINLFGLYFIFGSFYVGFSLWFSSLVGNLLGFLFLFVWGLLFLFFGNMFPEIITNEDGLLIRFLFWRLRVKWNDLVGIQEDTLGKFLSGTSHYVVKTKALTPFHRFYGLYARSFSPSFMIKSNINDFSILKKRIQEHIYSAK